MWRLPYTVTIAEITVDQEAALSGTYAVPPGTVILPGDHLVRLPRRASACRATVTMTVVRHRVTVPRTRILGCRRPRDRPISTIYVDGRAAMMTR